MKYLAILKDCLLESLDSKVLFVMLGLSLFVIVLIGIGAEDVKESPAPFAGVGGGLAGLGLALAPIGE